MKRIKEWKTINKLGDSIESILDIKESWYKFYLIDTSDGKKIKDDFYMPAGMGIASKNKYIIAIDSELWINYLEEADQEKKRKKYAKFARVLAHELMHLYQFKCSFDKYSKEFYFEKDLPSNQNNWTDTQHKKYINLNIELEAYAFGILVESKILNRKRIYYMSDDVDKYKYRKVYAQIKHMYEKKIEKVFCNFLKLN